MESIRNLYKIGHGPSSSHTMAPQKAAQKFKDENQYADSFRVTLYGSLAATGKGHMTDTAIINTLLPFSTEIVWQSEIILPYHTNGMKFEAIVKSQPVKEWIVYSIGGGDLSDGTSETKKEILYDKSTMKAILEWCQQTGKTFWEYVEDTEGKDIYEYLLTVWKTMEAAIHRGMDAEGLLPGGLGLQRKSSMYSIKAKGYQGSMRSRALIYSYALAVSEENASGNIIVTAPTCGSCGVLPSVLYHLKMNHDFSDQKIIRALATAGLIGNIVKTNASVSGAEVGCQGEVGVACAMAAGAACQLFGGSPQQVEYAAEMGLEHHLGLTCDPICGLVQVPCIERNAFAAARALDSCSFAMLSDGKHLISFDKVVRTMQQTGHDLPSLYKETSTGGLAVNLE
ncbi:MULTISPECIES: L-serine ammonia-lyase [unclassified Dysgonomonas]|uniref:L-serine ammonia-lyase n=1 Tax=unclassified Dysgonomonas TaxID=2630389 RepID=UPI0025C6EA3C|nr:MULTISPECIES: L-serine ammonia-lyase [unclassified Dysgonomonas]MDR2005265.1 L-serine ammonia-lyase [Prevotella sp.]HMM02221.1 L-serine ammonia-lyase [Dysgonomonas sp.]